MKVKNLVFIIGMMPVVALAQNSIQTVTKSNPDSLINRFCIDVNGVAGIQAQSIKMGDVTGGLLNPLNPSVSSSTYTNGYCYGGDLQAGYFFGHKRNWGIGLGVMFLYQSGSLSIDHYHMEYQAVDFQKNVYRQVIASVGALKDNVQSSNIQSPVVVKYRRQLNSHWGVAADFGALLRASFTNTFTTSSVFNYEAVYRYTNGGKAVYDGAQSPDTLNDWLITAAEYNKTDPVHGASAHFSALAAQGYNVALDKSPNAKTGSVTYKNGLVGLVFKPSITYKITPGFYLDLGLNYLLQKVGNSVSSYVPTGKTGTYTPIVAGERSVTQQTLGLNIGTHFYFNKRSDRDGDGILDRNDKCPDVWGLRQFDGCPDTDHDGIPDASDSCPKEFGLVQFNGCPDSDGDGVPDKEDRCPKQAGPAALKGCPDADGDGIPDIDDRCPHTPGIALFGGCPDSDGDGIPDYEDSCPYEPGVKEYHGCPVPAHPQPTTVKTDTLVQSVARDSSTKSTQAAKVKDLYEVGAPVLFDVNSFDIKESSKPTLQLALDEMKKDKNAHVRIDAYTDGTGSDALNDALSVKRAESVKNYLVKNGADAGHVRAIGHGKKDPVAPNNTPEGRERNRRTILALERK